VTATTRAAVTAPTYDAAGNQREESAPSGRTTYTWDSESRLLEIVLPTGARNTMSYRTDGLRYRLSDSEGDKRRGGDKTGRARLGDHPHLRPEPGVST
jgi:YD repeat-containing protein